MVFHSFCYHHTWILVMVHIDQHRAGKYKVKQAHNRWGMVQAALPTLQPWVNLLTKTLD